MTISLGDTCVFRLAGVDRRTGPFTDVELRSGDLLVFGGAEPADLPRRAQGVGATAPEGSASRPGRLSITVRETGLPVSVPACARSRSRVPPGPW